MRGAGDEDDAEAELIGAVSGVAGGAGLAFAADDAPGACRGAGGIFDRRNGIVILGVKVGDPFPGSGMRGSRDMLLAGVFPFRFGGQPDRRAEFAADPFAECGGIVVTDVDDGQIRIGRQIISRILRTRIAGVIEKLHILTIRDLGPADTE